MANSSIKIQFVGQGSVKKYAGDGYEFNLADPASCVQDVPSEVASRLLSDFPKWFVQADGRKAKVEEPKVEEPKEDGRVKSFMEKLQSSPENITKDQINDWAAANMPDIDVDMSMKKADMVAAVINAAA